MVLGTDAPGRSGQSWLEFGFTLPSRQGQPRGHDFGRAELTQPYRDGNRLIARQIDQIAPTIDGVEPQQITRFCDAVKGFVLCHLTRDRHVAVEPVQ